jgi:hypothetical protein
MSNSFITCILTSTSRTTKQTIQKRHDFLSRGHRHLFLVNTKYTQILIIPQGTSPFITRNKCLWPRDKKSCRFCIVCFVVRDVDVRIQVIKEFDIGISNYETDVIAIFAFFQLDRRQHGGVAYIIWNYDNLSTKWCIKPLPLLNLNNTTDQTPEN